MAGYPSAWAGFASREHICNASRRQTNRKLLMCHRMTNHLLKRCAYDCSQLTPTIITRLISSNTVPITVAPTKSYCSRHWKISTGAIKSLNGKLLDTITMLPNSPNALLKASAVPVSKGGSRGGRRTFVKVYQGDAPSDQAASSTSFSIS